MKPTRKTSKIMARVEPALSDALKRESEKRGIKTSAVIRFALVDYLKPSA